MAWRSLLQLYDTVYKNSKNENALMINKNMKNLTNKICPFNNIVILCLWMCGHIYITNGQNKKKLQIYNFFRIMYSFPKTGSENC